MTQDMPPGGAASEGTFLGNLRDRREARNSMRARQQRLFYAASSLAILMPVFIAIVFWVDKHLRSSPAAPVVALYALLPIAMALMTRMRVRQLGEEIQDLDFEIDLREFLPSAQEGRAEKMLHISNAQLRRYYDLNLSQNTWIFALGAFCIALGVAVIGVTFYLLLRVADEPRTKIITAAVGAIGSLLVNFVAAIYLKMHADATSSLTAFHSRLVETHQTLLANLLASRIEDESKRWETLSQLATNVAKR